MWQNKEEDPGGSSEGHEEPPPVENLLANIKEVLRNSDQSNVTQEKVEEYINTLTKVKAKRTLLKKESSVTVSESTSSKSIDENKKQRITLLRQQLEENKAKLAERSNNQKGIEEMVTQLKAQLNDSQQMMSPLNLSVAEMKQDYSVNNSPQELYNILLVKEKKITELTNKIHKLEGNVLDLQENLKEKDSVIDARTKAITLMSENLSKKGKSTLDALEETKEQMRTMQNNFVQLEEEMKARQIKLLEDIRTKNMEITYYQENIADLKAENERLGSKDTEKSEMGNLLEENKRYIEKIQLLEKQWSENTEVATLKEQVDKLKKQLDDSNKSTIKAKAQYQKKLKEQNKKIEAFKKISDSNAFIVKLQAENSKLTEKIAELEEEKGNIQLTAVEAESRLDFDKLLEEKQTLEADLEKARSEIQQLTEKLNVRVSSEMNSIQFEEQIERIEKERGALELENQELLEKIEEITKQKQELSGKLDHYIQENMELVDKLEKLSAEKVSSAESIEIVEGLTQQEKLEYQKSVEQEKVEGTDTPVELNESVIQLNEDSTELLQKIEMFNAERREVMGKLEELREENNSLALKLKGIENNRDVLAEAYEQLQTEKEKLDEELDSMKSSDLKARYDELLKDYDDLKRSVKDNNESMSEKDLPELNDAKQTIKALEEKLASSVEEVENYRLVIEENKTELINSSTLLNELQNKLREKEDEVGNLNGVVADLNGIINKLESENEKLTNFELLENQLSELKHALNSQLEQAQEYEQELDQNSKTINNLNNELISLNKKLLENEHALECKDDEVKKMQNSIKVKDERFRQLKEELERRCEAVQKQVSGNSDTLSKKVEELTTKNKEQLEKMRKIAANLKKKTQELHELQEKYNSEKEKWELEVQEKESNMEKVINLENELIAKQQQIEVLNEKLSEFHSKKHETSLQEELTGSTDGEQFKESNVEMLLETKENELLNCRDRINKLEETVDLLENQRIEQEQQIANFSEKIASLMITIEEKTQFANELELKLVLSNEDIQNSKTIINDLNEENADLKRINAELDELNIKLTQKQNTLQERASNLVELQNRVEELETLNATLNQQISHFEGANKHLQGELEKSKIEMEKIESEFQQQMEQLSNEKNELVVNCEKMQENLTSLNERETLFNENNQRMVQLTSELDSQTVQLSEARQEIERLNTQINTLKEEWLVKTAKKAVDDVIVEAEMKVMPTFQQFTTNVQTEENSVKDNSVKVFSASDFFENIPDSQESPLQVEDNSKEELLKKIKTLEFMLYSMEKDKNDALLQCHEMSNELTRLVYERENAYKSSTAPTSDLESQIVSVGDVTDSDKQLQPIEFAPVNLGAVEEEVIKPQEAYLCYKPPVASNVQEMESQIVLDSQANTGFTDLHDIEFTKPNEGQTEAIAEQKQAYLCYQPAVGENDDGWGWSPEEAKLEEEHLSQGDPLRIQIEQLTEQIRVFQVEREGHLEEIKQLQVKSGKLVKKCKELKQKADRLEKNKGDSNDFLNLDEAIQEELKMQVNNLEKKIKEINMELEKEKHEKSTLLKKVETLTHSNERMIEEKEKQSLEIINLHRKQQETVDKLGQFEWGGDDFGKASTEKMPEADLTEYVNKIEELNQTIKDLALDNEELQALLEEQRNIRVDLEKSQKVAPELQTKYNLLVEQFEEVQKNLVEQQNFVAELQAIITNLSSVEDKPQYLSLLEEKNRLEGLLSDFQAKSQQESDLLTKYNSLVAEYQEMQASLTDSQRTISELNSQLLSAKNIEENPLYTFLLEEKHQLINQIGEAETKYNSLYSHFEEIQQTLQDKQRELQAENNELLTNYREMEGKFKNPESSCDEFKNKYITAQQEMFDKDIVIGELQSTIKLLENKGDSNEKVHLLENEIASLKREKELVRQELIEEHQALETQIKQMMNKLENQKELYQNLQIEMNQKNSQIEELTNELAKKNEEMELKLAQTAEQWQIQVDQRGMDVAESWKMHLQSVEAEFANIQSKLQKEVNELEEKCNGLVNENNELRKNVDAEIRNEVDRNSEQQKYIADLKKTIQEKQGEIEELKLKIGMLESHLQQLQIQLNEKESKLTSIDLIIDTTQKQFDEKREVVEEIVKLLERNATGPLSYDKQQIIDEFERQVSGKMDEIARLQQQVEAVKTESEVELSRLQQEVINHGIVVENYQQQFVNLENTNKSLSQSLEEKSEKINELTLQLEQAQNNKEYTNLERQLEEMKDYYSKLQEQLTETQQQLASVTQYYNEKCVELDNVTYQFQMAQQNVQFLETDLNNVKQLYSDKLEEFSKVMNDQIRLKEETEDLRDKENSNQMYIAQLTEQLQEKNSAIENVTQELQEKQEQYENMYVSLEEEQKQVAELKAIIEDQVIKIEDLKRDLYDKSNDYDSMVAQMDIGKRTIQNPPREATEETPSSMQAELDLALYSVHQLDVRCDELTVELIQLLEERDILQLKLSNAIREKEELMRKVGEDIAPGSSTENSQDPIIPDVPSIQSPNDQQLQSKLTELKSVAYKRDKTLVDEKELRRLQQIAVLQHETEKLPPEAAAKLVDASYTLSRDVQSTSKVLLNWLWGRSTPKQQNDI